MRRIEFRRKASISISSKTPRLIGLTPGRQIQEFMTMSFEPAVQDIVEFAESVADQVAFGLAEFDIDNVSNALNAHIGDLTDELLLTNLNREEAKIVAAIVIDKILMRIDQYQKMAVGHA
jgi:hypothetical protein